MILVVLILLLVVVGDLKNYKVKNTIILAGMSSSFICKVLESGVISLDSWVIGIIGPIIILFIFFVLKVVGAGDIKLFSVIGGFYGIHFALKVIVSAFILGAVLAVFHFIRRKDLMSRLQYLAKYISEFLKEKKLKPYYIIERDGRDCVIHFTPAIAIGTVLTLYCEANPEFVYNSLFFIHKNLL